MEVRRRQQAAGVREGTNIRGDAMADKATATNIRIQDSPSFDQRSGQPVIMRNVSFMVGAHGPFHIQDTKANLPSDAVKTKIQQQVDEVNDITSMEGAG